MHFSTSYRVARCAALTLAVFGGLLAPRGATAQDTTARAPAPPRTPKKLQPYSPPEKITPWTTLLRSGPMVTYSTMREVGLWVQLHRAGGAQIEYWERTKPQRHWRTPVVLTTGPDHIAELVADSVQPGRRYVYRLWASDIDHERLRIIKRPYPLEFRTQTLWQGRQDPPDVRAALGSGTYVNDSTYDRPGESVGGQYGIFSAINRQRPDLMIWLGDNTYLREADWDSPTGIRQRYAHTRELKTLQPLLGATHHYATWDDHDYGPKNADRSFALRETTLQNFRRYWPALGRGQGGGGVASTFTWADVQFFLLDNRWHRTPIHDDPAHGQLLGPAQLSWLTEALVASPATFKVVCVGGQVLNPVKASATYANYETERAELLRRLAETRVPGVIFVSGDRQHGELTRLERPGLYPLYDLTTSPLTASPVAAGQRDANPLRDSVTFRAERNFAVLDVNGPVDDRTLTLSLCGADGQRRWARTLRAAELQPDATPPAAPPTAQETAAPAPEATAPLPAADLKPKTKTQRRTRRQTDRAADRRPGRAGGAQARVMPHRVGLVAAPGSAAVARATRRRRLPVPLRPPAPETTAQQRRPAPVRTEAIALVSPMVWFRALAPPAKGQPTAQPLRVTANDPARSASRLPLRQ